MIVRNLVAVATALTLTACANGGAAAPAATPATGADTFSMPTNTTRTPSGLQYVIDQPGTGATAMHGQLVRVHYTGWLTNGEKFDSSRDRGTPYEFALGANRVIKGWDEGVSGMKVGERRTLVVPANLAYGSSGMAGVIPPNAVLVFKVELVGTR